MTNRAKTAIDSDSAIHPGVTLADELEAREMTQKALAEAMRRPVQVVNKIVNGKKAVTAETALQLEHILDIQARFWMNLQTDYDLTSRGLPGGGAPRRTRASWVRGATIPAWCTLESTRIRSH